MAFVFLNHYLDITDAILENDPNLVDNSIFEGTDVPMIFSIPQAMFLDVGFVFLIFCVYSLYALFVCRQMHTRM